MPELLVSFLIAVGILVALFVLVPMLDVCNDRCQRFLLRRRSYSALAAPARERAENTLRNAA